MIEPYGMAYDDEPIERKPVSNPVKEVVSSELPVISARLDIEMFVNCPNCYYLIDLLLESDTNGDVHNDDGYLLRQMFPKNGTHDDFECDEVTCTQCKFEFNVKGLEW
jgi:hypothetical protein